MKTVRFLVAVLLATGTNDLFDLNQQQAYAQSGSHKTNQLQKQVTSEFKNASPANGESAPGIKNSDTPPPAVFNFEAERKQTEEKIGELEKLGAGVKPYRQALASIDEISKTGDAANKLKAALDRLKSSAENQLATMQNRSSTASKSAAHAASTNAALLAGAAKSAGKSHAEIYGEVAQSILRRAWKPTDYVSQGVSVFFTVDEDGAITNVAANPNSKGNAAEQLRFKEFVSGHPELPPPPKGIAPLKLIASQDTKDKINISAFHPRNPHVDYSSYMAEVQRKIKRDWHPPHVYENKRVTVIFRIDHDGRVIEKKIKQSAGIPAADAAALTAIDKAAPFPPLPKGGGPDVAVSFTFDCNAFRRNRLPFYRQMPGLR